jgi:hypothetical protein
MSLTVFLAICILGCDVLIYFLYEWAFGESERIRKRHPRSRLERSSAEICAETEPRPNATCAASTVIEMRPRKAVGATVIEMQPRTPKTASAPTHSNYEERLAYYRIAASHASVKRRA